MRNWKRFTAAMMASMLLLAGCGADPAGGNTTGGSTGGDGNNQASSSTGNNSEQQAADNNVEDGEKPTLKWLSNYAAYDPNSEYVAGLLEELTGYEVEYYMLPAENADQRLSLELSSGTSYDVLKLNYSQYSMLAGEGALLPLNSYLDENPGIYETTNPLGWYGVTQDNGDILGIPEVATIQTAASLGFRKDLFDEYGWSLPETVDDFYQLLKDIKEETGKIPLTGNQAVQITIASGFGFDTYDFEINDGKVQSYLRNPGVKEYLKFMNQLYVEGLIDPDWPVNKNENIDQKMSTGEAVMTHMSWSSTPNWTRALQETIPEASFESIMPLSDSNGVKHIDPNTGSAYQSIICIPKTAAANAPYVVDMVEKRLEKDTFWKFNAGTEGVHYTLEDGIPIPIQPKYAEDMTNGNYFQTSVNYIESPITWLSRVRKDELLYEAWRDMNSKVSQYEYTYDPFYYASFPEYDEYHAALAQRVNDYFLQVIAGTESIDTYDDFLAGWEAAGGLEYEAGAQKWYDNNLELAQKALEAVPAYRSLFVEE